MTKCYSFGVEIAIKWKFFFIKVVKNVLKMLSTSYEKLSNRSYRSDLYVHLRLFLNQTANFGRYFRVQFFPEAHENRRSFNLSALKSNSGFHFLKNALEF